MDVGLAIGICAVVFLVVIWRMRSPSTGVAGTGMTIGREAILLEDGYAGNVVTWIAVRNWPATFPADARINDDRFNCLEEPPTYRDASGKIQEIAGGPRLYFYDGRQLTTFPIRMTQRDIDHLHAQLRSFTDYRQILESLRRFEVPQ